MNFVIFPKKIKKQSGNALFLILIAVALFAALSYAITQSGRGGGNVSKETSMIQASQITQYGAELRSAVTRMNLLGVADTDLCFDTDQIIEPKWYDNNPSCANDANKVFHPSGGGATYRNIDTAFLDSSFNANTQYGLPIFTGRSQVALVGNNTEHDLVMLVPFVKREICENLNENLGLGAATEHDYTCCGIDVAKQFNGAYGGQDPIGANDDVTNVARRTKYAGFREGCIDETGSGAYIYYHVLLER